MADKMCFLDFPTVVVVSFVTRLDHDTKKYYLFLTIVISWTLEAIYQQK